MGLFDNLNKPNQQPAGGNKTKDVVFSALPETLEEFISLPQASLSDPFDTAAMTVLALCFYPKDKELSLSMLGFLKGPGSISEMEKQFIADRFRDSDYVPRSYFNGAVPGNDYAPSAPYTITVSDNPYSYTDEGYAVLYIRSFRSPQIRSISSTHHSLRS